MDDLQENLAIQHFPIKTLIVGIILLIYTICSFVFSKLNFHFIHESGICMLLGAFISIAMSVFSESKYTTNTLVNFDEEIFFNLILPPIIFAAGYNLRKRAFFKYFSYSFMFGIIGTFITFMFISFMLFLFNNFGCYTLPFSTSKNKLDLNIIEILAFSAIISATDTVAPLTFIKEDKKPKLFAILFGEGVLNDAVCIVLYKIINNIHNDLEMDNNLENNIITFSTAIRILSEFSYLFILSLFIGAIGGLLCAYSLKKLKYYQPNRTQETSIIILFAFITYSSAELLYLSSVIALLFSGIFMSQYAYLNLSFQAREESCIVAKILSNFAEAFVFCYLGLSCMNISLEYISIWLIIIVFLILILGRMLAIVVIGLFINKATCFRMGVDVNEQVIMTFSGFIRGAISYGLVNTIKSKDPDIKNTLIATCFIIVFLTTFSMGGSFPYIITRLERKEEALSNENNNNNFNNSPITSSQNQLGSPSKSNNSSLSCSFVDSLSSSNYLNDNSVIETFSIQRFDRIDNDGIKINETGGEGHLSLVPDGKIRSCWKKIDNCFLKPFFIDDWPDVKKDHNEISIKMIELFSLHQQKKRRNKEMTDLMAKVQEKKESLVKY